MSIIIAFIAQHWRLTVGLALAATIYVQHQFLVHADTERDTAQANAALWQKTVDSQNGTILALKHASDARDSAAQKAVDTALALQKNDEAEIRHLLTVQPKVGEDRCKAAHDLIWQTIQGDKS